eukprot:Amastigsp_a349289_26.p4 type:complete len:108 gc:universal Amastigsp_a349289_26:347-24(-)
MKRGKVSVLEHMWKDGVLQRSDIENNKRTSVAAEADDLVVALIAADVIQLLDKLGHLARCPRGRRHESLREGRNNRKSTNANERTPRRLEETRRGRGARYRLRQNER